MVRERLIVDPTSLIDLESPSALRPQAETGPERAISLMICRARR